MTFPRIEVRRLSTIANGGTPTPDSANWGGDVPWATPVDLGRVNGRCLTTTDRTLTHAGAASGSTIVPAGSVILSTRAPIGYTAVAGLATAFNQGCKALVPFEGVDSRYLRYTVESTAQALVALGRGSTFLELNSSDLAAHRVPAPSPTTQWQIADYLDHETAEIDAFIAELLRLRDLSLEEHEVLRSSLLLGGIPGTGAVPLKYLARVTVGIVVEPSRYYTEDGVPALRGLNVAAERVPIGHVVKITAAGHAANPKSMLATGDVVVVRTGQAGAAALVPPECDGWNAIDLLIVKPRRAVRGDYLAALINSREVQSYIRHGSVGAIQAHFNVESLANLRVPPLPMEEQASRYSSWATKSAAVQDAIADIDAAITLAKERRAALITAAVTGQIDVTTKQPPVVDSIQTAIKEAR